MKTLGARCSFLLVAGLGCGSPAFLERLNDPERGPSAFLEATGALRSTILHYNYHEAYRLRFGGARPLWFSSGEPGALVLLRGRRAPCGTGIREGGVKAPPDLPDDRELRGILVCSAAGAPLYQIDESRSSMAVLDADGDGRPNELVRWRNFCDYTRLPFLIIHDLSRPGAPVLLSIELNPQAIEDMADRPLLVDLGDGRFGIRKDEDPIPRKPTRSGGWRFESTPQGTRDVVIEENLGGKAVEVARFHFDRATRRWTGLRDSPAAFWKTGTDCWLGARFTAYDGVR